MSNTAASVLSVARSQIGVRSGKKYWDYVMGGGYVSGGATPWCACFVSWCFHQAGAKCAGLPSASCTYGIYAKAKKAGKVVSVSKAKAGDVVLFNFDHIRSDAEHVGIVESVGSGTLVTIEGNTNAGGSSTGGQVCKKVRSKANVFAIVRPDYDKQPAPKPVVEQLVVDGIAGAKTVRRWQQVVGSAYLDGVISGQYRPNAKWFPAITSVTFEDNGESQLVKICQHKMGITADGYIGQQFARALNKRLGLSGTTIDKACVMALQKQLNTGRF